MLLKKLIFIVLLFFIVLPNPKLAHAQVSAWQKGATVSPISTTTYSSSDFKQSLDRLKSANANYVTLIIPYYQDNNQSSSLHRGWNTPSDDSLVAGINYARSIGLNVMLKIHPETNTGDWRRYIEPSDKGSWFQSYGSILNHYADIAQANGVSQICLGSETYNLTSHNHDSRNTQFWNDLIAGVRSRFSGSLTYSAQHTNPTEGMEIQFWDKLDYIGLAAYFPLATGVDNPSLDQLRDSWNNWNNQIISPLSAKWNKPILFTEIGYRSVRGAHKEPAAWWRQDAVDLEEQARDYEALFSYWHNHSFMQGVHWWEWEPNPNAGGPNTSTYTPQNKLAQDVMSQWFSNISTEDPPGQEEPQDGSFQITVSFNPSIPKKNQPLEILANITSQSNIANVIIDFEVYDSAGNKIFQHYLENQNLTANQVTEFKGTWIPDEAGNYQLKLGIFSLNWSSLYHWENNLSSINVEQSNDPPPIKLI